MTLDPRKWFCPAAFFEPRIKSLIPWIPWLRLTHSKPIVPLCLQCTRDLPLVFRTFGAYSCTESFSRQAATVPVWYSNILIVSCVAPQYWVAYQFGCPAFLCVIAIHTHNSFLLHKYLTNSNTNKISEILSQRISSPYHWNLNSEPPIKEWRRFGGRIDFASPRSSHHVGTSFLGIHPFSSALSFHKTRCLRISLITIAAFWPSTINISPSCTACCAIVVFVLLYAYRNFLAQVQLNQRALIPRAKKYMVFLLYSIVHLTHLIFATSNPRVF